MYHDRNSKSNKKGSIISLWVSPIKIIEPYFTAFAIFVLRVRTELAYFVL